MAMTSLLSTPPTRGIVRVSASAQTSKLAWKKPLACYIRVPSCRLGVTIRACAAPCEVAGLRRGVEGFETSSVVLQCVKEVLVFHEGRSPELIRAVAYLRALSFYTYPEGRTEEALKLHRKMKTDDEFTALTCKVAGLEQGYKRIVCILALYPLSCLDDRSVVDLHPALKVTFANGKEHVLVGSLDLNQGKVLPGEIVGSKPEVFVLLCTPLPSPFVCTLLRQLWSKNICATSKRRGASIQILQTSGGLNADRERGYLSNVCVAPLMRQRGIGVALLQQSQKVAQLWGITNLYVHVVATNEAAVKLYNKGGFQLEKEESASDARRQARPRRSLLHKLI